MALPYDRDSVLHALERRGRTPRPPTAPLESLFAAFRGPFSAYSAATVRLNRLRDSVAAAKGATAARLGDSIRAAEARTDRAKAALDRARREFASRGDSLRL